MFKHKFHRFTKLVKKLEKNGLSYFYNFGFLVLLSTTTECLY